MNRADDLEICLESVAAQDYGPKEIIVVDNASSDDTVQMIKERFPGVKIVFNNMNAGPSRARNQGCLAGGGEFLWFLDSDSRAPHPRLLSNMVRIMKNNNAAGAVGGELLIDSRGKEYILDKQILGNGDTHTSFLSPSKCSHRKTGDMANCKYVVRR